MCGIVGFSGNKNTDLLHQMTHVLYHRGPDDVGYFEDSKAISLGHRRLSIIDLKTGQQPIYNHRKTQVIVYNGEVYNFLDLRTELEKQDFCFQTATDTEVIVNAFSAYGVGAFEKFNGMFAFAIWDREKEELFLVRDRFGIKPLYYAYKDQQIIFASEIKSILLHPKISKKINEMSVSNYFSFRYIPGEETIYQEIRKLPPGHYLQFKKGHLDVRPYWNLFEPVSKSVQQESLSSQQERFNFLFQDAVQKCLISDVPVGLFLSGGVDSTSLAGAIRNHQPSHPLKTFSIGFNLPIDELSEARKVSDYFDTEHHEFTMTPKDMEELPKIIYHMDEPNADSIMMPIYLLSQKASQHVKVVLSGEGADELLGGYFYQKKLLRLNEVAQKFPPIFFRGAAAFLNFLPVSFLDLFFEYSGSLGPAGKHRLLSLLKTAHHPFKSYQQVAQLFTPEEQSLLLNHRAEKKEASLHNVPLETLRQISQNTDLDLLDILILREFKYWLPDYILLRQDKLAMAHALEVRVPYLDHRLFELILSFSLSLRRHNIATKKVLRDFLCHLYPKHPLLQEKKKKAFYMPLEGKFSVPFQGWIRQYLDPVRIKKEGLFNVHTVEDLKRKSSLSPLLYHKQLMSLIVWEMWREQNKL